MADQTPEKPVDETGGPETPPAADAAAPEPAASAAHAGADGGDDAVDAMAEAALQSAESAADALRANVSGGGESALELPSFDGPDAAGAAASLALLNDVDLQVKIELGRTRMYLEDVLRLNENSVVELDKAAGDPVDIYVNGRHIARGEVLVLGDNFCIRISEIIEPVAAGR